MNKNFANVQVSTGRDSSNRFNLSCFHATTTDYYSPRVTYFKEFVPDEKWSIDARCSVRCLPMIKPTIADITVHNRFFFVPFYSVMAKWDDFLAESPVADSTSLAHSVVPYCYESDILDVFSGQLYSGKYAIATSALEVDFTRNGVSYMFTKKGRVIYSILNGLGYVMNSRIDTALGASGGNKLNCLGILSYLKIYLDWYNNSSFDTKRYLESYFDLSPVSSRLLHGQLDRIFDAISNMYLEKDYFTSATLYPVGTNSPTMQTTHSFTDPSSANLLRTVSNPSHSTHGTPLVLQNSAADTTTLTKYSLDAVNALTDYVKRHQLAGIQPFNRILAEYGVTLDDEVLRRSTFIGDIQERVDIDTVVSSSYADDTALGERGGLAGGASAKSLSYHNKNFGCIICVTTVVPRTSYTDGIKRHMLRTDRFDFFTPSVEHLGTEPLYVSELFNNWNGEETSTKIGTGAIFGYMPRYAAYKTALDTMSGDFMVNSRRLMYDPWVMRRKFPNIATSNVDVETMSENFTVASGDKVSDIFLDEDADNFIIFNMYHVTSRLPMHKLYDDYQWSNEDDDPMHVTIPNQGVQMT